jgi:hypothetical protein
MALIINQNFASDPGGSFATIRAQSGTLTATYNAGVSYDLANSTAAQNLWDITSSSLYSTGEAEIDIGILALQNAGGYAGLWLVTGAAAVSNGVSFTHNAFNWTLQTWTGGTSWAGNAVNANIPNSLNLLQFNTVADRRVINMRWDSTGGIAAKKPTIEIRVDTKLVYSYFGAITSFRPAVYINQCSTRVYSVKVWDAPQTALIAFTDNSPANFKLSETTGYVSPSNPTHKAVTTFLSKNKTMADFDPLINSDNLAVKTESVSTDKFKNNTLTTKFRFGLITGTTLIKGTPSYFDARKVMCLDESTNTIVASAISAPVTGYYEFSNLNPYHRYTVLGYDYTGQYNSVIASNQLPYIPDILYLYASVTGNFTTIGISGVTATLDEYSYDTYFTSVSLAVNANGANNQTTIFDKSPVSKTFTTVSNAKISTTQSKFGGSSLTFDGSSYITTPNVSAFDLSAGGNFTVEAWINVPNASNHYGICGARANSSGSGWCFYIRNTGQLYTGGVIIGQSYVDRQLSIATIPTNTWVHVAFVKTASTYTAYINGVSDMSISFSAGLDYQSAQPFAVGALASAGELPFLGYIDDFRFTKGVARYTTTFTPPIEYANNMRVIADPYFKDNVSYLQDNGTANDISPVTKTPTIFGTVLNSLDGKFGNANYFSGAGCYVQYASHQDFNLGSDAFTIEWWERPSDAANRGRFHISNTVFTAGSPFVDGVAIGNDGTTGWLIYHNTTNVLISSNVPTANVWAHYALIRVGDTFTFYKNGVSIGTDSTFTGTLSGANTYLTIGAYYSTGFCYNGYMSDFRITKGIARYTANFTSYQAPSDFHQAVPSDTYFENVSLLLDCEGVNSGTSFKDASRYTKTIGTVGSPTTSTTITKFGTTSLASLSNDSGLTVPSNTDFDFGTGDFTIEFWFYRVTGLGNGTYMCKRAGGAGAGSFRLNYSNFQELQGPNTLMTWTTPTNDVWHHLAISRTSGTMYAFIDGIQVATTTSSYNLTSTYQLSIGRDDDGSGNFFGGYMDDIRITKGIGRYTTGFTLIDKLSPIIPSYNDIQFGTNSLLLKMNGTVNGTTFSDATAINTVTAIGNAKTTNLQARFDRSSLYCDGIGSYLSIPHNSLLSLTTGDFTIELWTWLDTQSATNMYIINKDGASGTAYPQYTIYITPAGLIQATVGGNNLSATGTTYASGVTMVPKRWYHIAVVNSGGTVSLYVNGALTTSAAKPTIVDNGRPLLVGYESGQPNSNNWNGYIDEVRISKTARYTAAFKPLITPFPTST